MTATEERPDLPRILPFQATDRDGVIGLIVSIQREEFGIDITAGAQPDLSEIPTFYQTGRGGFWVAKAGETVVGTIGLKDIGDRQGALRKMFVASAYRGGELGVARRLLEQLLAAAEANGMRKVLLGTTDRFRAAHRFYEKHGFGEIPREALPASFLFMAVDTKFYAMTLPRE